MSDTGLPAYDTPPVNEVVCGVRFRPVENLTLGHLGMFWSTIADDFPRSEQQEPLISPDAAGSEAQVDLFAPRLWLIHKDADYLIQLQKNIFYLNWRRADEGAPYPHYAEIAPKFFEYLDKFNTFLGEHKLTPPIANYCELAYVNLIHSTQGWEDIQSVGNLMRDLTWDNTGDRFLPAPKSLSWGAVFELPDANGSLRANLQTVVRRADGEPALRLELNAHSTANREASEEMQGWFDLAHEWIVRGFADVTEPSIQKEYWGRKDVN